MINTNDLDKKAIFLGKLMGVLADADGISVNTDWFRHPVSEIAGSSDPEIGGVDTRLHHLVGLIDSILGPAVADPPDVIAGSAWYSIPDTANKDTTPFYLVMPKDAPKSGEIGIGTFHRIGVGKLVITAYVYAPLFSYSPSGASFLINDPAHPLKVGALASSTEPFSVGGATFTGLRIEGSIYLSGAVPGFTMTFENLSGTSKPPVYTTLASLLDPTVMSWIGEVIVRASYWLDLYVGSSNVTIGGILTAAHFLSLDDKGVYHLDIQNLQGTPTEIALNFLFAGLDALSELEIPLIELPGGGIYVQHRTSTGDYGLRMAAQLSLPSTTGTDGKASPSIDFSLGSWLADETNDDNWMSRITGDTSYRPGLSVFLLRRGTDGRLSFAPGFDITSFGVNITGGGDAPLFDINGYVLGGAQIRTYLSSENWPFGFIIRMADVGFPLAPNFDSVGGNNPVAKNLLASGSQQGSSTQAVSTTNPTFSAQAGYISGNSPLLEIFDADGNRTDVIWFPIQRRFGPVDCRKVGLKIQTGGDHKDDPVLGVIFDGNVALGPLEIDLDQLSVDAHLREIANVSGYSLDLQGLNVSIDTQGVEISGGLLKRTGSDGIISYDGQAMIKYKDITLAALGSYTTLPGGGTSMFIFAILNKPIGGPAFFYVTGLSAGFGYNRTLRLPAMDDVQSFPLVSGLSNPSSIGGTNPSPTTALEKLQSWVPPSRGDYWLAAGVQFTTFQIINTNALLIVQFGKELIVSVLGVSTLKQPQSGSPWVYAQLGIRVVFRPEKGELEASAVLAPGSFVLTPSARLTGGFAFHSWFDNNPDHPGDFVFTIGGYHPAFAVPAHYPQVPRVGINWQVSRTISIVGDAYFAITPAAMMAGGTLQLTFADGPLKAWLKAQADVILFWKPFYLLADVSVSVGVSFRIHVLFVDVTLSVEIGCTFHLWGPPIGGSVHVDWYVISFTIGFGSGKDIPNELTWDQFKEMLPHKTEQTEVPAPRHHAMAQTIVSAMPRVLESPMSDYASATLSSNAPAAETRTPAFLNITGNKGPQEIQQLDGLTLWLVRPGNFQFTVGSAVPASTIVVESKAAADNRIIQGSKVSIRRVNGGITAEDYRSTQTVTILRLKHDGIEDIRKCLATSCTTHPAGCDATTIDVREWEIDPVEKNMPQAMWGKVVPAGGAPKVNEDVPTIGGTVGVTMYPKPRTVTNCTPEMKIVDVFADRVINKTDQYRLSISQSDRPYDTVPVDAETFKEIAKIAGTVSQKRASVFAALQTLGVNGWSNASMQKMAANPGHAFADEPMEGTPVPVRSVSPTHSNTRSSI